MKKITLISFLSSSLIFAIMMTATPKVTCAATGSAEQPKAVPCKHSQMIEF